MGLHRSSHLPPRNEVQCQVLHRNMPLHLCKLASTSYLQRAASAATAAGAQARIGADLEADRFELRRTPQLTPRCHNSFTTDSGNVRQCCAGKRLKFTLETRAILRYTGSHYDAFSIAPAIETHEERKFPLMSPIRSSYQNCSS